jgi:hypothetical protein
MSKHTPGPWLYRGKSDSVHRPPPAGTAYQYGDTIFRFHDEVGPSDEDLALILSAPELLEALKYARRFLRHADHDIAFVDAAIAKATGMQP